jgi:nicotinate-nucleotide pyrophosphorylase
MSTLIRAWPLALALLLAGCGLAETAATTATSAQSAAQQAADARKTEDQVRQRLDEAARQDAARRAAGEAETQ